MRNRQKEIGESNIVGLRIKQRREELGMKQNELLTQLQINDIKISPSGLSKLEGQTRACLDYELVGIAKALNISVAWLLGIE